MRIPNHIKIYLEKRINEVKTGAPGALIKDGSALMVSGSIGYDSYVSPNGDIFMETYDLGDDSPSIRDDSVQAQIMTLILGSRIHPILRELLPSRSNDANDCENCLGSGYVPHIPIQLLCQNCGGLGWTSPTLFQE